MSYKHQAKSRIQMTNLLHIMPSISAGGDYVAEVQTHDAR